MKKQWVLFLISGLLVLTLGGSIFALITLGNKNTEIEDLKAEITALEKELAFKDQNYAKLQDQLIEAQSKEPDEPSEPNEEQEQEQEQPQEQPPQQEVAGTQKQYFLTDFENYAPQSTANIIGYKEAREIAQIGFEESARRIAGEGTENEASEKMEYNFAFANNYFTRQGMERDKTYDTIQRPCYIFTRTNDMGCGVRIYVDAVTGLIIGGDAFGD